MFLNDVKINRNTIQCLRVTITTTPTFRTPYTILDVQIIIIIIIIIITTTTTTTTTTTVIIIIITTTTTTSSSSSSSSDCGSIFFN